MHQKRCITCCIVTLFKTKPENTKTLNFYFSIHQVYFSIHQVILTIFPTLLFAIWYSTISRYLAEMEREGNKWGIQRDANGNIVISLQKQIEQAYQKLDKEPFNQLPSIQKWLMYLKSGRLQASRIQYVVNIVHGISDQLKVMPETIVSYGVPIDATKRKELAIEYWQNFLARFYCISSDAADKHCQCIP